MLKKLGISMLACLAVAGCSDSDAARDKCNDLVKTLCSRVVSCAASDPVLSATYTEAELTSECESAVRDNAHCGNAFEVSDDYESCLEQSSNLDCAASNSELSSANVPTPLICKNVIRYGK